MSINIILEKWQEYLGFFLKYSSHTIKAYQQDLDHFISFLKQHHLEVLNDLSQVSYKDFRAWLVHRHRQNLSHRSTARALSSIKNFFSYIETNHNIFNPHVSKVQAPRLKKTLPKPIQKEELKKLIEDPKINDEQSQWVTARNQALFALLYGCGLRISEALNLNIRDVLFSFSSPSSIKDFFCIQGKGNKERMVPVHPAIKEKIEYYLSCIWLKINKETPLFLGHQGKRLQQGIAQKFLRDYRNQYGLPEHLTPHALRHSCATHLLSHDASLRSIQELLGHVSVATTQIYTEVEDRKMTDVFEKAHPRELKG